MGADRKILLFLGAPGAGKGTLAQRCCSELSYEQLSTGNLCREHIAQATQIGKAIDLALKSGKLVDDSLITAMVTQWFSQYSQKQRVILDGFPRTVIQAETFDRFIGETQVLKPEVVKLAVSEQVVIDRLGMRLICSKGDCQAVYSLAVNGHLPAKSGVCDRCSSPLIRRPDDEIAAIKKRLKLYTTHEAVLLDFYQKLGYKITTVDASVPMEQVFAELKTNLEACL